ncbi:hypothetical protein [Halomonas elongata]|uniref:Uncharacterized protein n=1 Tax=Halomonas elongata (strain ATCC 33173 / DSM 2581 / NBRC 15536 / NCIMB 2198 / 1H9) TaxID=768066 RepID=A0ABZ0T7C7_HALED|nr:hypothetical protein [Halomonas elongata]WBF17728.1 hypothetical protein LM502_16880 [Halomonas elongata]WPU46570.1 hypothetical protein SR933_15120 [Halomonas elongata DSM 2581]
MPILHLTDNQFGALKVLVDRGVEELATYLQEGDPRIDGYSDEEVADLRRLEAHDADEIQALLDAVGMT